MHKFTILQSSRVAEFLGDGSHYDVKSIDTTISAQAANNGVAHSRQQSAQTCDFMIKHIGRPQLQRIPIQSVQMINYAEKSRIFGSESAAENSPSALLQRLARLDETVAVKFMVKPDTKARFNFRLIHTHMDPLKRQNQSFIALSYRRKIHVEKRDGHFTLPLEAEMFQAMLDERVSEYEGVWIDQICIDQESETEKNDFNVSNGYGLQECQACCGCPG